MRLYTLRRGYLIKFVVRGRAMAISLFLGVLFAVAELWVLFSDVLLNICVFFSNFCVIDLLAILKRIRIKRYFAAVCRIFKCAQ